MFSLQQEERCGHLVTEETKKLWQVQLGILAEIQRVCKKHNIRYFATGGTLLGAVRHKGYIPWDDDVDLAMLPEDYDKFCAVAAKELPEHLYFQIGYNQNGLGAGICKVRDCRTTGATVFDTLNYKTDKSFNCGIFVDVFCLFNVPETRWEKLRFKSRIFFPRMKRSGYLSHMRAKFETIPARKKVALIFWRLFGRFTPYSKVIKKQHKILSSVKESSRVGFIGVFIGAENLTWYRKDFEETVELPFEDTTICCPKNYDNILRKQFGDYMEFVKGAAIHTMAVFDTDTPYPEKLKNL